MNDEKAGGGQSGPAMDRYTSKQINKNEQKNNCMRKTSESIWHSI